MKKNLLILSIVLIMIGISSCKKFDFDFGKLTGGDENTTDTTEVVGNPLVGKWQWISTSGGIGGVLVTPESTNDTKVIEFTNESIYKCYLNDSLIQTYGYSIIKDKSILTHDSIEMIRYTNITQSMTNPDLIPVAGISFEPIKQSFELRQDTLILGDLVFDGFGYTYIRIE